MPDVIIHPIAALTDNYIWIITHEANRLAVVIDPGEAKPVLDFLAKRDYRLYAILITHHHWDHTNGIAELLAYQQVPVYYPALEKVAGASHPLQDQQRLSLEPVELDFTILHIPGHTRGHIAYYNQAAAWVFTGDTLFAGGCGRIFEGSVTQMYDSLQRLKNLPSSTEVYCGHEYTQQNLEFAIEVEPSNLKLQQRLQQVKKQRQAGRVSLPSTIGLESATNPFLRCDVPSIQQAMRTHSHQPLSDERTVFAKLRQYKDNYG